MILEVHWITIVLLFTVCLKRTLLAQAINVFDIVSLCVCVWPWPYHGHKKSRGTLFTCTYSHRYYVCACVCGRWRFTIVKWYHTLSTRPQQQTGVTYCFCLMCWCLPTCGMVWTRHTLELMQTWNSTVTDRPYLLQCLCVRLSVCKSVSRFRRACSDLKARMICGYSSEVRSVLTLMVCEVLGWGKMDCRWWWMTVWMRMVTMANTFLVATQLNKKEKKTFDFFKLRWTNHKTCWT